MDPNGQYDPTDSAEDDMRDPAQQALDRSRASGDTSYEGLLGEPSGTGAGATGVVGEPSGTGAGASGVAGSSADNIRSGATQQGLVGTDDLASAASRQGIDPFGYDTTDTSQGGLTGVNNDPNQNVDPNQGGMSGQGGMFNDPNQGMSGMSSDPKQQDMGGQRGYNNPDRQSDQSYNDPSSNS